MLNKLMMDDGLPGEETFLINTNYRPSRTFNVTIPDGVKVLKAYIKNEYADSTGDGNIGTSSLWNNSSQKTWLDGPSDGSCTVYVGVSANKTYTLYFYCVNIDIHNFSISYSASINQQTPSVTDY